MASWGSPISAVLSATRVLEILPNVEPPVISERLVKVWTGTPACLQISRNIAAEIPSVQYFWFPLNLRTMPPFKYGRLESYTYIY